MKGRFIRFLTIAIVICLLCGVTTVAYASAGTPTGSNGWVQFNGDWYWFRNGSMVGGWVKTGGLWYYMDPADGHMLTGWQTIDGATYYLNPNGDMLTGWLQAGSDWYWFNDSGAMVSNCWVLTGGKWYWFNPDGTMATGWQIVGGRWYFLNPGGYNGLPEGAMATGWLKLGGDWYWLDSSGAMAANCWVQTGGKWYWLNSSGAMTTGWVKTGGYWYYMDPSDGHMLADEWVVDYERRVQYYLMSDGRMATKESEFPVYPELTEADLRRAEAELDAWAVEYYASLRPDVPKITLTENIWEQAERWTKEGCNTGYGRCLIYGASERRYEELFEEGKHAFLAILEEHPLLDDLYYSQYLVRGKTIITIENNTIIVTFPYTYNYV